MILVSVVLAVLTLTSLLQNALMVCILVLLFGGGRKIRPEGLSFSTGGRSRLKEIRENWRAKKTARRIEKYASDGEVRGEGKGWYE